VPLVSSAKTPFRSGQSGTCLHRDTITTAFSARYFAHKAIMGMSIFSLTFPQASVKRPRSINVASYVVMDTLAAITSFIQLEHAIQTLGVSAQVLRVKRDFRETLDALCSHVEANAMSLATAESLCKQTVKMLGDMNFEYAVKHDYLAVAAAIAEVSQTELQSKCNFILKPAGRCI
jgi:hypothetical protein